MGELILKKASGATIVETIVALTISLFLFLLVTMLFVQITGSSVSVKKTRAREALNEYSVVTAEQKAYFDEVKASDEFRMERVFSVSDSFPHLVKARFLIYDTNNQLVDEINKWITVSQDE